MTFTHGQLEQVQHQIARQQRYSIPYSNRTRVGISTLWRYLRDYQAGGLDTLCPQELTDKEVHAPCR